MGVKVRNQFYFSFLLVVLIFQSCFGENMHKFENMVNRITQKIGIQVEMQIPILRFIGMGGSSKNNIIKYKELAFNVNKKLEKNEGVELISKIVDIYLKNIYSEKSMESYLKEHPFTYKNLHVVLYIHNKEGDNVYHPDNGVIALREENMVYKTNTLTEKGYPKLESYITEPYEEAVKRIRKDK